MRTLDFSSLHGLLTTLLSLAVITLIGVGIRLLTQVTIQQRHERMNRQINERLRALMAAYKTLGGSFTGDLTVNPAHLHDLLHPTAISADIATPNSASAFDRPRRVRDAVESALSDIILLGTEEQVRLAAHAAQALLAGTPIKTQELVVSLRAFIREALDLELIPADIAIPLQGPARPSAGGGKDKADKGDGSKSGSGGGGGMGGGGMGGGGMGMGGGTGGSSSSRSGTQTQDSEQDDDANDPSSDHV